MLLPDLGHPIPFITTFLLLFSIIFARYLLFAGVFYLFFNRWFKDKWHFNKINTRKYSPVQLKKELTWSIFSTIIFSLTGVICLLLWQKGHTRLYAFSGGSSYLYLPISLCILLFLHETYYYWLHRWMHIPSIFKLVHRIHHESNTTSPFTAFSFHPLEGLLQAIFFPIVIVTIPLHYSVIISLLLIMTFSSMINHLGFEIYPTNFNRNKIGKWLIGATHHSLHHMQFKYNFGLYFTFWDKIHKTDSSKFDLLFDQVSGNKESIPT